MLRKELRLELRAPQAVPAMALFSVTTFVVFHFALQRGAGRRRPRRRRAVGDAAVRRHARHQPPVRRRPRGGRLRRLPAGAGRPHRAARGQGARRCSRFLVAVEVVAVPAFALLLLGPDPRRRRGRRAGRSSCCSPTSGIAVVGTLVGALAVQTRARDLIVPLLALPLLIPVVIARRARRTTPLFLAGRRRGAPRRAGWPSSASMIWSSGCSPTRCSTTSSRTESPPCCTERAYAPCRS